MRTLSYEKFIAYLALFSGLSLSAVAAYYSVAGLMVIFAAAAVPVMIMGAVLELSKLVATVWLKQNWEISPFSMKAYLLVAILVFMLITSMGIFGFLSKGHSDQAVPTGEVSAQISIFFILNTRTGIFPYLSTFHVWSLGASGSVSIMSISL